MRLRPYQAEAVDAIFNSWNEFNKTLLVLPTGCHAKGSEILMYDVKCKYSLTKKVENIIVGDKLMGADGKAREVLVLHKGIDDMYKITPINGEPFVVNAGHILHLRKTGSDLCEPTYPKYVDISVKDYLKQTKTFKHLYKLERVPSKNVIMLLDFKVEYAGKDEYFGFTVDADNLYLDNQFIVHHNCGKTICFSKVAEKSLDDGDRNVLILAHREELLIQAQDKIKQSTGIECCFEKAGETALDSMFPITCASVQTLMRESRLRRFSPHHYDKIIIDEAHHALSDSYQNILKYFSSAKVLGVTATPDRGDKKNLGKYFENIAYQYSIQKAIRDGYLSKILVQTIPLKINLQTVKTTAGDYSVDDLGSAINPYLEEIAKHIPKDRKTLIFLPLIATSKQMVENLRKLGHKAEHIDGTSQERKEILSRFANGQFNVLCNSMLLTEGFDDPTIDCIVCLRPTKIRSLYAQIIGRGTRIAPNKENLLVLDFLWQTTKHDLCHVSHLIAENEKIADKMIEISKDSCEQMDLEVMEKEASTSARKEREKSLADAIKANVNKKGKSLNPIEFALSLHDDDLQDYEPTFEWEKKAPTSKQLERLECMKFNAELIQSRGLASMLLSKVISRRNANLATPSQLNTLSKYNFVNIQLATFGEASYGISAIAKNGWRPLSYGDIDFAKWILSEKEFRNE